MSLVRVHRALIQLQRVYPSMRYTSAKAEAFLSGTNTNFLEAQYADWMKSRGSIDGTWDGFYESVSGPTLKIEEFEDEHSPKSVKLKSEKTDDKEGKSRIKLHLAVQNLIRSYQVKLKTSSRS